MRGTARLLRYGFSVMLPAVLLAASPGVRAAEAGSETVFPALQTTAVPAPQTTASTPAPPPAAPLRLANPANELPPLRDDLIALDRIDGSDPLLARERSPRRSTADLEPRGSAVMERRRPLYDPLGIRAGGFTIFPNLTIGAGAMTDAVPIDGSEDVFGWIRAAAVVRSNWSRHRLVFDGFVNHREFATYSSEGGTSWLARARGHLDVHGRDRISAEVSSERIIESRGVVGEILSTSRPTRLTRNGVEVGGELHQGRFDGELRLEYQRLNYDEDSVVGGQLINPRRRDSDVYRVTGEIGYQFAAPRTAFVSVSRAARRYDIVSIPARDSNEYELLAGIRGEITPLIRGRFSIGYTHVDFRDGSLKSRGGVAFDARLQYLLTELTTLNLSARRSPRNIASPNAPIGLTTDVRFGADHELLRNLIISSNVYFQQVDFSEGLGPQRLIGADLGANFLISPRWRASVQLGAIRRTSRNVPEVRNYNAATLTAGLTWQF